MNNFSFTQIFSATSLIMVGLTSLNYLISLKTNRKQKEKLDELESILKDLKERDRWMY